MYGQVEQPSRKVATGPGSVGTPESFRRRSVPWRPLAYALQVILGLGVLTAGWWVLRQGLIPDAASVILGLALSSLVIYLAISNGRWWALLVSLSPTILLMSVFPLVIDRVGVDSSLILTVSVAVPWVAQAVTWPMYRPLNHVSRTDTAAFAQSFAALWPALFLYSLLPVALVSGVLGWLSGWGTTELLICVAGLISNVVFTQSLLVASDTRRHGFVVAGWMAYAACLLLAPQYWYVAPFAGVIPQILLITASFHRPPRLRSLPTLPTIQGIFVGGLMGSLLWADKFLLILFHHSTTPIVTIYIALVPVVLAQGVYFASQQGMVAEGLGQLYARIKEDPASQLGDLTSQLTERLDRMFARLALLAILSGLAVLCLTPLFGISHDALSLLLFLAPPVLFLLNLHVFQFFQFQTSQAIMAICLGHIIVAAGAFWLLDPVNAYIALIAVDLVLVVLAHLLLRRSLSVSPYRMFWKKASEW